MRQNLTTREKAKRKRNARAKVENTFARYIIGELYIICEQMHWQNGTKFMCTRKICLSLWHVVQKGDSQWWHKYLYVYCMVRRALHIVSHRATHAHTHTRSFYTPPILLASDGIQWRISVNKSAVGRWCVSKSAQTRIKHSVIAI